jgi:hypothetical protein
MNQFTLRAECREDVDALLSKIQSSLSWYQITKHPKGHVDLSLRVEETLEEMLFVLRCFNAPALMVYTLNYSEQFDGLPEIRRFFEPWLKTRKSI